ncbi:GTP-binding protein [Sessilibacter corallicola]|uniref:ATP/GTP-binding protein n=1 Tax=Sessilibacter corallicola TaxID=2904075 RepID=A0ABQ0AE64_9GAMM|nr:ATP/GTP-binding protein [Sessilibacter corallicola]
MSELKLVITGTAGVGKTTAIHSLSDKPPIVTDADTTDELSEIKDTTTVAFDFGEIYLDDATVHVYGTPGQERFRHMWEIIAEGALGFILLVDARRKDPIADLEIYLDNFRQYIESTSAVIGVTRTETEGGQCIEDLYNYLEQKQLFYPIMAVDPRDKSDMSQLMLSLLAMLEYG